MSAYDAEGRRKYLSRDEGKKFLSQAVLLPRARALFCLTIYYTGCRISEAVNLKAADIDTELNVIRILCLKKRGKREVRRIPVPEFLAMGLVEIGGSSKQQRIWRFHRTTGWRTIKKVMAAAGISGIHATTKGLRHGFGVRGALEQIPVSVIRDWMGHADSETTAIYLAVRDEEERELMGRTWK
ncbi:tyrosine-type recombinase/integrase [Luteolibacter ambystomatis]